MSNTLPHSRLRSLVLHLVAGVPASLTFLLLARPAADAGFPPLFAFLICVLGLLVPAQVLIMRSAMRAGDVPLVAYDAPLSSGRMAILVIGCLSWAVLCFALLEPILARPVQSEWFAWWPREFMLGDYLRRPESYARDVRIMTWCLGIVAALVVPVCEEIYFRGYLMPRIPARGIMVPAASTVLFVLYHFWSPWLTGVRILAVFPLYYFTWRTRNIYPAVIVHVLLNLVGDVIIVVPIVFS